MSMTPEQIADWFGKPAAIMPGESAGIPEDPQVEAQMIFDAWKKFYQDNPNAKPPAGAAPDEKQAYYAAHPFRSPMDEYADKDPLGTLEKFAASLRRQEAADNAPYILAALVVVAGVYFLTSGKKAAAA